MFNAEFDESIRNLACRVIIHSQTQSNGSGRLERYSEGAHVILTAKGQDVIDIHWHERNVILQARDKTKPHHKLRE
jgi:hypothetical protein